MQDESWHRRRMGVYLFLIGLKRRITLGTRIALLEGERVYLVRHTYLPGWHFPGGGVEPGETPEAGAARELREESGYQPVGRPELFGLYHNTYATRRDYVALYLCRLFEQDQASRPDREIAEAGWFDRLALPLDTTEATRRRLAEIFEGGERSEAW